MPGIWLQNKRVTETKNNIFYQLFFGEKVGNFENSVCFRGEKRKSLPYFLAVSTKPFGYLSPVMGNTEDKPIQEAAHAGKSRDLRRKYSKTQDLAL